MKITRHWRCCRLLAMTALGIVFISSDTGAFELTQRSVSKSGQFVVFSNDSRLRLAVTDYAENAKQEVMETLDVRDHWKLPVVIDLRQAAATDTSPLLRQARMVQTDGGWRVEINVLLREGQLKKVRFPQLLMRAILLEIAYREHLPVVGTPCTDPPSWLVEALAENMQSHATGSKPSAALFRQLLEKGEMPKIRDFLKSNVEAMDATSLAVYDACASSLLDMLVESPEGKLAAVQMLKGLGDSDGDPVALLLKYFPVLGGSELSLEKWWTLGLARSSAKDGNVAFSVAETDARLASLLTLSIITDEKTRTKKDFALVDFRNYMKLPGAKSALITQANGFVELAVKAHPLLRPVVQEYLRLLNEILLAIDPAAQAANSGKLFHGMSREYYKISNVFAIGKYHRLDKDFETIANYRDLILNRMDKIDDYLNWYEATQMPEQSGAFEDFLRDANAAEKFTPPKRNDAISKYIDQLQREFE